MESLGEFCTHYPQNSLSFCSTTPWKVFWRGEKNWMTLWQSPNIWETSRRPFTRLWVWLSTLGQSSLSRQVSDRTPVCPRLTRRRGNRTPAAKSCDATASSSWTHLSMPFWSSYNSHHASSDWLSWRKVFSGSGRDLFARRGWGWHQSVAPADCSWLVRGGG